VSLIRRPKLAWLALALPLWMIVSGAFSHPDYLAYFNEFAGSEPERIIVDSDLDWNQSTKALARRLKELGATEVNFGVNNGRGKYMETWPGPAQDAPDPSGDPGGRLDRGQADRR